LTNFLNHSSTFRVFNLRKICPNILRAINAAKFRANIQSGNGLETIPFLHDASHGVPAVVRDMICPAYPRGTTRYAPLSSLHARVATLFYFPSPGLGLCAGHGLVYQHRGVHGLLYKLLCQLPVHPRVCSLNVRISGAFPSLPLCFFWLRLRA